jgi:hypothetical protein
MRNVRNNLDTTTRSDPAPKPISISLLSPHLPSTTFSPKPTALACVVALTRPASRPAMALMQALDETE